MERSIGWKVDGPLSERLTPGLITSYIETDHHQGHEQAWGSTDDDKACGSSQK